MWQLGWGNAPHRCAQDKLIHNMKWCQISIPSSLVPDKLAGILTSQSPVQPSQYLLQISDNAPHKIKFYSHTDTILLQSDYLSLRPLRNWQLLWPLLPSMLRSMLVTAHIHVSAEHLLCNRLAMQNRCQQL